jgi:hypothetical protein
MNQVSWSRILQRAGDEQSGENGADIIDLQDRLGRRRGPGQGALNRSGHPGDLELELRHALDRASHRGAAPQRTPRPAGEIAVSNAMPVPRHLAMTHAPRRPRIQAPQSPSGTKGAGVRNVIAISLSCAVVAFAYYQISAEWPKAGDAASSQDLEVIASQDRDAVSHTGATNGGAPTGGQSSASTAPSTIRLDLRPSFAPDGNDANALADRGAEAKYAARPAERAAAAPPVPGGDASALSGSDEQAMLRRGRELIEKGHVSGARMIFEHLAGRSSALGAFALGQTYDARYLASIPAANGADADQALAAKWYQRAAELSDIPGAR